MASKAIEQNSRGKKEHNERKTSEQKASKKLNKKNQNFLLQYFRTIKTTGHSA